jgi:hypothetical protein
MTTTISDMNPATEEQLIRYARVLADLGAKHGLSNFRRAGDGQVIADVEPGTTYLGIARFEIEAEGLLRATVSVIPSGTAFASQNDRGPLAADQAA